MIKGAQKQMIVIRTGNSRYFDEAYFVLRRDLSRGACRKGDMLSEANRILAEHQPSGKNPRRHWWRPLLFFGIGLLLGVGVTLLVCLV